MHLPDTHIASAYAVSDIMQHDRASSTASCSSHGTDPKSHDFALFSRWTPILCSYCICIIADTGMGISKRAMLHICVQRLLHSPNASKPPNASPSPSSQCSSPYCVRLCDSSYTRSFIQRYCRTTSQPPPLQSLRTGHCMGR